jgi:hypothetical protein
MADIPASPPNPFQLTFYDKAMTRLGWLGDPLEVQATPRHMAVGDLAVTVPLGHPKLGSLLGEGKRMVCTYHGEHLIGGMLRAWTITGGASDGTVTLNYTDDFALLYEVLGWPNPTQLINAQNTGGVKEDKVTGAAETVAKTFITRNAVTRLGLPVTVATTHSWGSTITVAFRMVPLADNLLAPVEQAGIGLTVRQTGTSLVVDAYQPATFPQTLTEESGIVIPGTASWAAATATRTVVAGPGVGTSREWLLRTDTGRESDYGRTIEVVTDASSSEVTIEREAAGDTALVAAAAKSGFSIGLSETPTFRYGDNLHVGDTVTVDLGGGATVTDILREATLTWNQAEGLRVIPSIGERADDPSRILVARLRDVALKVRGLLTR